MIRLHLVTRDDQLVEVCRDVVASHLGQSITLRVVDDGLTGNAEDLYFIDISSNPWDETQLLTYNPTRTALFAARNDLIKYADMLLRTRFSVIIKPASPIRIEMIMRQFLEPNCTQVANQEPSQSNALLQSVLEANMRLQAYDQDRNNFLARAMHDFRTPLTSLEGYSGLLLNQHLGEISHAQAVVLERMQQSIRRLTYLTEGMFHISLGKNALPPLKLKPDTIESCIDQAIHEVSGALAEKNINLTVEIASPPDKLSFERIQIEQVLVNLLENALKFSPRSGSISILAYPYFWDRRKLQNPIENELRERRQTGRGGTNSFRIEIADSGPGVSKDSLASVFEAHRSILPTDERSGTGLGLTICKLIVERHRGAIWAEPTERGATFCVVLPSKSDPEHSTHWVSNQTQKVFAASP